MPVKRETFLLYLIKPSHYDDDGYVIQWLRSAVPSNTLATLNGLFLDCIDRRVLGPNVHIVIKAVDETNTRVQPREIIADFAENGGCGPGGGMVGFVGVQSNQFPRAMDLARPLAAAGVQVCIGGFHVSGCLAMLPETPPDIKEAMDLGLSIFAGEAEGRLDQVLQDAYAGKMAPLYNYMNDLPGLEGAVTPSLPLTRLKRTARSVASFDAGRGCPFHCSFCTIINVQGRKSRRRSPDDIEQIIRRNAAQEVYSFFITDDNLARNKDWEKIFDRIIYLREEEKIPVRFIIQVDTLCHLLPNFIEKAGRAGVRRVFIGLENINPDSLMSANKRQNRITDYRKMLQAWRAVGVVTYAGYILGFPGDTPESIVRDIEIIKRELPIDLLEFFYLTPLPGSQDHKTLSQQGVWMDPDMNKFDLVHVTTGHAKMSKEEWERAYHLAWKTYFTPEHIKTVMRRAAASGMSAGKALFAILWFYSCVKLEGVHPLEGGYLRRKYRRDRRPGRPIETPLVFYPRYMGEILYKHAYLIGLILRYGFFRKRLKRDPDARNYTDLSLTPVVDDEFDELEIFGVTHAAQEAVSRMRAKDDLRAKRAAAK